MAKVMAILDSQKTRQIDSKQAMEKIKQVTSELSDTDEDHEEVDRIEIPNEQRLCPTM